MMRLRSVRLGIALIVTALAASTVLASSSASYGLTWHALTGGGGTATGPSYQVRGNIVTSTIGVMTSAGYRVTLGYWPGLGDGREPLTPSPGEGLFLPLVRRGN